MQQIKQSSHIHLSLMKIKSTLALPIHNNQITYLTLEQKQGTSYKNDNNNFFSIWMAKN